MIYLDYAAGAPMRDSVREVMQPMPGVVVGNPQSTHQAGVLAKQQLRIARTRVAELLSCAPEEIIFVGSGTESINLAIKGVAEAKEKGHIITTKIEHKAVLATCKYLESRGFTVTYLDVDSDGFVSLQDLEAAICDDTILLTIGTANNEIGTIQPIGLIGEIARKHNVLFHTDACQAAYLPLNMQDLPIDLLTLNSTKVGGPQGVGLLYKRSNVTLAPQTHGGGQEGGMRAGTHNLDGILGFTHALEAAQQDDQDHILALREHMLHELLAIEHVKLNGSKDHRLANNINITFLNVEARQLVDMLSQKGVCVSTGSACTSDMLEASHVILAIGVNPAVAHGTIRISLGIETTLEEVNQAVVHIKECVNELRGATPVQMDPKLLGATEHDHAHCTHCNTSEATQ